MTIQEYAEKVMNELKQLPKEKIIEAGDFIDFLKNQTQKKKTLLSGTEMSKEEAANLRNRLLTFEEDWNVPGMEKYDEL